MHPNPPPTFVTPQGGRPPCPLPGPSPLWEQQQGTAALSPAMSHGQSRPSGEGGLQPPHPRWTKACGAQAVCPGGGCAHDHCFSGRNYELRHLWGQDPRGRGSGHFSCRASAVEVALVFRFSVFFLIVPLFYLPPSCLMPAGAPWARVGPAERVTSSCHECPDHPRPHELTFSF